MRTAQPTAPRPLCVLRLQATAAPEPRCVEEAVSKRGAGGTAGTSFPRPGSSKPTAKQHKRLASGLIATQASPIQHSPRSKRLPPASIQHKSGSPRPAATSNQGAPMSIFVAMRVANVESRPFCVATSLIYVATSLICVESRSAQGISTAVNVESSSQQAVARPAQVVSMSPISRLLANDFSFL